ncbi:hypothetical protein GGI35DRAFT_467408 [Trichoderma velutinum]
MGEYRKVAVAGATGNLGSAIVDELVKAGFEVTGLTRQGRTHTFPTSITVKEIDYDLVDSIAKALEGQDAVVSTMSPAVLGKQNLLIDAAVKAGVKRFLPSEFGSNPDSDKVNALPVFGSKVAIKKTLQDLITTGPFLDRAIGVGLIIDVKNKSIDLYDGGDIEFSTTLFQDIGKAVAGVLKHPDETKNRTIFVQSTKITQRRMLDLAKTVLGSDGWKENMVSVDESLAQAYVDFGKQPADITIWTGPMIRASVWGKGYGGAYEKLDNELLSITPVSEDRIIDLIKSART